MRSFRLVILFANSSRFLQFAEAVFGFQSATITKKISVASISLWVLSNFSSDVFQLLWGSYFYTSDPRCAKKCPYLELFWSVFYRIRTIFLATVSNPNAGKYWPEKLWTRILSMQWHYYRKDEEELITEL